MEWKLAIETLSIPAAITITTNEPIVDPKNGVDIFGTESVYFLNLTSVNKWENQRAKKRHCI